MAQFLGDIAFLFEMVLIAGGLVLLHRGRQEGAGLLRVAAIVLLLAGTAGALCTTYFWFRYHGQGDFDRAYPMATAPMMSEGMMQPAGDAMMPGSRQGPGGGPMMQSPSASPSPSDR